MPRTEPNNVNLQWCETHELMKMTLRDGTVLRLGTASVTIPDGEYAPSLMGVSGVKQSLTRASDRISVSAQNVDRQLGIMINDVTKVITGARVEIMRVFWKEDNSGWHVSTMLDGEIRDARVDQEFVVMEAVGDLAPGLAFLSNRTIESLGSFPQGELREVVEHIDFPEDTEAWNNRHRNPRFPDTGLVIPGHHGFTPHGGVVL